MLLALIAALPLAQTAPAAPPTPRTTQEIVVRGKRTEKALAACLARACPTNDDARLSIAHAESQFAEGKYRDARTTLDKAIVRNRDAAAKFPRHVAALYEAYSTVSLHYGDLEDQKRASWQRAKVLRENLDETDPQLLLLTVGLGDSWLQRGFAREAERQYRSAERGFRERGDHKLAALAALRGAAVRVAMGDPGAARAILQRVDAGPAAADPAVRTLSAVMATRIRIARGDDAAVDRLLATLRTDAAAPPILLDEPGGPGALQSAGRMSQRAFELDAEMKQARGDAPIQWADIGFMVSPEGKVSDVEVLRSNRVREWTKPLVERVSTRRYAPIALEVGHPGLYRVERFTLRAMRVVAIGSLIRRASGPVSLEILDLTAAEVPPPPPTV